MASGERKKEESLEEYHQRLKTEEVLTKMKLMGRPIWNSSENGTYKKSVHGKI